MISPESVNCGGYGGNSGGGGDGDGGGDSEGACEDGEDEVVVFGDLHGLVQKPHLNPK